MKATRTVYCYYFPQTRKVIDEVIKNYPHKVYLKSIKPGLDDYHKPLIEKYIKYHKDQMNGIEGYDWKYYCNGASEGIFHLLAKILAKNPKQKIYTLRGEYEGYKEYAKPLGIKIIEVEEEEIDKIKKGIFFISNPSARDGNIISNSLIEKICKKHKVIYDLSYMGLTRKNEFDLTNKNIIAIVSSMSKPFGLYYYRVGFVFAREEIPTLFGNKWFKNIISITIAEKILDTIKPQQLYKKYRKIQEKTIKQINLEEGLDLEVSDVILLTSTKTSNKKLEKYKRRDYYRLCLTPYYLEAEVKK